MNDDQMDELLMQGVRDYNSPGTVPREEMWARIAEGRKAAAVVAAPRGASRWRWAGAGVAAAALLAAGIGIGQRMGRPSTTAAPVVAKAPAHTSDSSRTLAAVVPAPSTTTPAAASNAEVIGKLREATRNTDRRVRELAASEPATGSNAGSRTDAIAGSPRDRLGARAESANEGNSLAYRLVVLQHLAGTEAMITSFRASAKRGEMDAQIASWSRELLSTTRMLEASTATKDPVMKRLLEDLDLVIAQIVQYSAHGTNNPDELDLIEQSINQRGVITKLRSTLPGRTLSAGT